MLYGGDLEGRRGEIIIFGISVLSQKYLKKKPTTPNQAR